MMSRYLKNEQKKLKGNFKNGFAFLNTFLVKFYRTFAWNPCRKSFQFMIS